jgi:hypothetical protein
MSSTGGIKGLVLDATTRRPIPDVIVAMTSPSLKGPQEVWTDKSGEYQCSGLPEGTYTASYNGADYKLYAKHDLKIASGKTIDVNVELIPG